MRCLIVGCGYVGNEYADYAKQMDCNIYAVTRSQEKAAMLMERGVQPIVVDWSDPNKNWDLPKLDGILVSVSHANVPGVSPEETHTRGMTNLFRQLAISQELNNFPKLVYLSTTGVFGSGIDVGGHRGQWLDESSPTKPERPGSMAALAAERWIAANAPPPYVILRLAGIYGPGRIPNLPALKNQAPLEVAMESFLNLIHVQDAARIIHHAMTSECRHSLYCVSDGHPVNRRNYYQRICEAAEFPSPQFVEPASTSAVGPRRGGDNKRISNRRLVDEWKYEFQYPSYEEGLLPLCKPN